MKNSSKPSKNRLKTKGLILAAILGTALAAQGDIIIVAAETGGDVVFSYSGSLNLTGATKIDYTSNGFDGISPSQGLFLNRVTDMDRYEWSSSAGTFGTGGIAFGAAATGDPLAVEGFVGVADGYVSGSPIAGTLTYSSTTFDALGVDLSEPKVWTMAGSGDTVTMQAIPEPSTLALLGAGLGVLLAAFCRTVRK